MPCLGNFNIRIMPVFAWNHVFEDIAKESWRLDLDMGDILLIPKCRNQVEHASMLLGIRCFRPWLWCVERLESTKLCVG